MVRAVVDWVTVQDTAVYVNNFPMKVKLSYKRISTIKANRARAKTGCCNISINNGGALWNVQT